MLKSVIFQMQLENSLTINYLELMALCVNISKNTSYRLNVALSVVLQAMLKHGFFPKQFMLIDPILKNKNGDITSISNYRSIALATVCSKIIEIFIVKQISDYLCTTDNIGGISVREHKRGFSAIVESSPYVDRTTTSLDPMSLAP